MSASFLHGLGAHAALLYLDAVVKQLVTHPGMTQTDKALLAQAGLTLSEVRANHAPAKVRPAIQFNPCLRIPGEPFTPISGLPGGWMAEREAGQEERP